MISNLKNKSTFDQRLASILLPCLVIMLGAALRFYDLGAESYWYDEVIMLNLAGGDLESILVEAQDGRSPVYVLLAHFGAQVFGTSETATRFLSALAGIASIALMYAVGCQLFGKRVGLLSAFLMTISEFQIRYSQEYRCYSLFVLMTLFSFFFFVKALKDKKPSHFVLYVLASILLFYNHTFGVFVLVAQGLYFLLQWNRYEKVRGPWLLCQIFVLLAIAPGLLVALRKVITGTSGVMNWVPDPPLWLPLITVGRYVFPGRHYPGWGTLIAGMAFGLIGTLFFATRQGKRQWLASVSGLVSATRDLLNRSNELLLVACWLLCPILIPFVLSKIVGPMYTKKYTISASPALYLFLALGMITVREVVPEFVSLGLLAILIAPGLHEYYVWDIKEQWREVAAYVEENTEQDDMVVLIDSERGVRRRAFCWYYRGNLPVNWIDNQLQHDAAIADALAGWTSGGNRFWLIARDELRPNEHLRAFFLDRDHEDMRLIGELRFSHISAYLFAVAKQ